MVKTVLRQMFEKPKFQKNEQKLHTQNENFCTLLVIVVYPPVLGQYSIYLYRPLASRYLNLTFIEKFGFKFLTNPEECEQNSKKKYRRDHLPPAVSKSPPAQKKQQYFAEKPYLYLILPNSLMGRIIGKQGQTIKHLEKKYNVEIYNQKK